MTAGTNAVEDHGFFKQPDVFLSHISSWHPKGLTIMEDPQAATDVPVVSFKKRAIKAKSNIRKREATFPPASDSDSGFTSSEDDEGRQIKRRRKNAGLTATSTSNPASRSVIEKTTSAAPAVAISNKDDATKSSTWYEEKKENTIGIKTTEEVPSADGTYRGQSSYSSFIQKNPNRDAKVVGPVKTSSNVRTITVTDFAPDVCKDYKQTGFCGFGDSCKFLHAREDYAQGWQLDREWEISGKGKKPGGKTVASANWNINAEGDGDDDEKLLESIPFACIICKENYKYPIVTRCGHYFCEACALKRYKKDPSCAACGAGTGGVFNVAKKLNRLLERKRERQKENGTGGGDDGGG